jgi:hypothetical protein
MNSMPFPISSSGVIAVRGLSVDEAIDRLEDALAKEKPAALSRDGRGLRFQGGAFRLVCNWNILVPISAGVLDVSPSEHGVNVSYRVTFTQMLVAVTLMVAFFMGPAVAMATPKMSPPGALCVLLVMWSWLFGFNFVLTGWRLPRFLVRALSRPTAVQGA